MQLLKWITTRQEPPLPHLAAVIEVKLDGKTAQTLMIEYYKVNEVCVGFVLLDI